MDMNKDMTHRWSTALPISIFTPGKPSFSCKDCQNSFATLLELKRHELTHSSKKQKMISCMVCSMEFSKFSTDLFEHLKIHPQYVCRNFNCNQVFETIGLRQKHEELEHSATELNPSSEPRKKIATEMIDGDNEHEPDDFEVAAPNFVVLENIPKSLSPAKPIEFPKPNPVPLDSLEVDPFAPDPDAEDPLATFQCIECNAEFLEKEFLVRHQCYSTLKVKVENEEKDKDDELSDASCHSIAETKRPSSRKPLKKKAKTVKPSTADTKCKTCSRKFKTKAHLATHLRMNANCGGGVSRAEPKHKTPKRIRTRSPDPVADAETDEIPHEDNVEDSEMPSTSSAVGETTSTSTRRSTRLQQGPFLCTTCGEKFEDKGDLRRHNCKSESESESESGSESESQDGSDSESESDSELESESENQSESDSEWESRRKQKEKAPGQPDNAKKYLCRFCGSKCRTWSAQRHHEQMTHPEDYKKWKRSRAEEAAAKLKIDDSLKRYTCRFCDTKYRTFSAKRHHEQITHPEDYMKWKLERAAAVPENKCKCHFCDIMCTTYSARRYHEQKIHSEEYKNMMDERAKSKIKKYQEESGSESADDDEHKCTECSMILGRASSLRQHVERCHMKITHYDCEHCDRKFYAARDREHHLISAHNVGEKSYKCDQEGCEYSGLTKTRLRLHREARHGIIEADRESGNIFRKKKRLGRHKRSHTEEKRAKIHTCNQDGCNYAVSSTTKLKFHKASKHGIGCESIKDISCDVCGKKFFRTQKDLRRHMRTHTRDRPYACEVCDSTFRYEILRDKHQGRCIGTPINTTNAPDLAEKLFTCTECDLGFKTLEGLENHGRVHTGEAPFKCSKCERCFRGKKQLTKHKTKYHPAPEKLKFGCTEQGCDKKFLNRNQLEKHMMTHSTLKPFQCHKCGATYKSKATLKSHIIYKHRYDEDVQKEYWNKGGETAQTETATDELS